MSSTVLLVDDNHHFLKPLSEYLAIDRDRYRVVTAGNGEEALDILSNESVLLVVSDIKMPRISGLQLLNEIRKRHPETGVVLMTAYGTEDVRSKVKQSQCLRFIEKPFNAEDLRQLILEQIEGRDEGFAGTLNNIQLADLIQMCSLSDINTAIRVTQEDQQGTIHINDRKITHAVCGDVTGEKAFYRIMGWASGQFETLKLPVPPGAKINKNAQSLLLEAARQADEKELEAGSIPEVIESSPALIRILVVDDSPTVCNMLTNLLKAAGDMEVVGTAQNGEEALRKIKELTPDVITLDVNMPVMDGSTALKHIMISNPCPVVILSSLGSRSHANVLDFLRLGAVDFLRKPRNGEDVKHQKEVIVNSIRTLARAQVKNFMRPKPTETIQKPAHDQLNETPCKRLIIVSSGAGGHMGLGRLLNSLTFRPTDSLVALQSMPQEFITALSDYFRPRCRFYVQPIHDRTPLLGGRCYIGTPEMAPRMNESKGKLFLDLHTERHQQPTSAILFDRFLKSVAEINIPEIFMVLLSGAEVGLLKGLSRIKRANARILSETPDHCVVPFPLEKACKAELAENIGQLEDMIKIINQAP